MVNTLQNIFLGLTGIPSDEAPPGGGTSYILDSLGAWRPREGDRLYDIERQCVALHDALAERIFGHISRYYALLPSVTHFVMKPG